MSLVFEEAHAAPTKKKVNEEWFVLANRGASSINTAGLNVIVGKKGSRGSVLGQIDPGFVLQPGERILVVSGIPGKKSQGTVPERDDLKIYHLFLKAGLLQGSGTLLRLAHNQHEVARLVFDPKADGGVANKSDVSAPADSGNNP